MFVTPDEWLVDSYGSTLGYRQRQGRKWRIELIDALTAETVVVPGSVGDAVLINRLDNASVIFLRNEYSRGPGQGGQVNNWHILKYDKISDSVSTIATGINTRITDDIDIHWPYVSVDGELIAYDEERPGRGSPARIVVRSIATGEVVRSVDVDGPVFGIELDGLDVTYVTGEVSDPAWSGPDNEQRIHAPVDGPEEVLPSYDDPWEFIENGVSVEVGRGEFDRDGVWRSTLQFDGPNGRSEVVATERRAVAHGDGLVVWQSDYDSERALTVYDTRSGQTRVLDANGPDEWRVDGLVGISDGWVLWTRSDGTYTRDGYNRTVVAVKALDVSRSIEELGGL